jgi:site-specific recombinase XerD
MRVSYLFFESNVVRIPFYYFNSDLFRFIVNFDGAKCDNIRHEFYFNRDVISKLKRHLLTAFSCVQIDAEHPEQLQVFGFFERPWPENQFNISANTSKFPNKNISNEYKESYDSPFSFPKPPSMPEMFPEHLRIKLEAELRARKYSPRTQRVYIYYNRLICRCLHKLPEDISSEDVTQFLATMEKNGEYSVSAMNLAISAIKFLFRNVLKDDKINEHHRPRQDERLPIVLSTDEIKRILSMEKNPKHRLLLMLAYSSGLRVSEVVALKKEHIDFSRKVIYIRQGKRRKDRSTILSEKAAQFIEEYINFFNIGVWLFPGQKSNRPLTIRSAQHIFDKSLRRAQIFKKISIHGLRHSFATHLLESGTDIRYIQSLLGHANIRTTERYTHVAHRSVLKIKSPLDTIL